MAKAVGGRASQLRPTWLRIDLAALGRNYRRLLDFVSPRRLWCVVKADAYGHGAVEVSRKLQANGADAFAVATVDEGIELRLAGISGRILVMSGIEPVEAEEARDAARASVTHCLEVAVWRREAAEALGRAATDAGVEPLRVHLKADTGMGRLGVTVGDGVDDAVELAAESRAVDGVRIEGVFSNLAAADAPEGEPGYEHTGIQIKRFGQLCAQLDEHGLLPADRHLGNSGAVLQHPAAWNSTWCTGVRPGLSLCGVPPYDGFVPLALEPVMSWHSAVAAVRRLPAGWPLGYGARRLAAAACKIAVVPVGYHDGFPRALSDRGEVLIGGRRAKVVGAISMDLTLVDITGISDVSAGDPVVLLGSSAEADGDSIGARELAQRAGSISHEVLCRVGHRVPRRYLGAPR